MESEEVMVELSTGFEYAFKGDTKTAEFITLMPPTFKQIDKIAPIKQAFVRAVTGLNSDKDRDPDREDGDEDYKIKGLEVIGLLYQSDCDMVKVLLHAKELFSSGAALVEGEAKLTFPLMEKMDVDDFENLLGEYIANFITPSLMGGAKKSTG